MSHSITLPPPATAAAREAAREPTPVIWHICAAHRRTLDGPCGPGCRMLCGKPWLAGSKERASSAATPDHCVVCWDLAVTE